MRRLIKSGFYLFATVILSAAVSGCGSDSGTGPEPNPPDTSPPQVTRAAAVDINTVEVVFNEKVDKASAEDLGNYSVVAGTPSPVSGKSFRKPAPVTAPGDPITVQSAKLQNDGKMVVLKTADLELFTPYDIEVTGVSDLSGNVLGTFSKTLLDEIRSGRVYVFAGTGFPARGEEDVDPLQSEMYWPQDLTFGPDGLCYILDWNNHRVRVVEDGLVHTIIGTGLLGDAPEGIALEIGLNHPTHVTFDPDGNLVMSAWHNSKVMRYDLSSKLCDVVVAKSGQRAYFGDGGPAIDAIVNLPSSCQFDAQGNLYLSDQANYRIRRVDAATGIITTVVGTGAAGFCGDGGSPEAACLKNPFGQQAQPSGRIEFDPSYNLYIADTSNHRIRMVTSGMTTGDPSTISTVAGDGTRGFAGDGGNAVDAALDNPSDIAVGSDGDFYIADTNNHCVRYVNPQGVISTVIGIGDSPGYEDGIDGKRGTDVALNAPWGVALDGDGNVYVADTRNHRILVLYK